MAPRTVIIRFPGMLERDAFCRAVSEDTRVTSVRLTPGEFLPDVIAAGVGEREYAVLLELAGPKARLFEDIKHEILDSVVPLRPVGPSRGQGPVIPRSR
jgi:hypothetical protein